MMMNIYLLAILKILAACGAIFILALRFIEPLIQKSKQKSYRTAVGILMIPLAIASAVLFTDIGRSHQVPKGYDIRDRFIHFHEQFHFFFGSKYLKELGYQNLYVASLEAGIEEGNDFAKAGYVRDLRTFNNVQRDAAVIQGVSAKKNFSPERWQDFRSDLTTFDQTALDSRIVRSTDFSNMLTDHGNTGSPAWGLVASLFSRLSTPTFSSIFILALLDYILIAATFIILGRAFGWIAGGLALTAFALIPDLHGYTGGSLLRFDWFFATALGFVWMKEEKYGRSGLAFGYAIASKVFPALFVLPLAFRAIHDLWKYRRLKREYRLFAISLLGMIAGLVFISSLFFGFPIWADYTGRLVSSFTQLPFVNQYGFRMAFLEIMSVGPISFILTYHGIPPYAIDAGQTVELIGQFKYLIAFLLLLVTAATAYVSIREKEEWRSLCLGAPLIYFFLISNSYYYGLLAFFALYWLAGNRTGKRTLIYGVAYFFVIITIHYLQHLNIDAVWYYVLSTLFGLYFALFYVGEILPWERMPILPQGEPFWKRLAKRV